MTRMTSPLLPRRRFRSGTGGFTLIELLVVVGIIALLVALLLPSLAAARARGRTAVCMTNMRSLAQGFSVYRAENGGRSFRKNYSATDFWMPLLEQYISSKNPVRICPEAPIPSPVPSGGWGTRARAWGEYSWPCWAPFQGPRYGSYGINGYMYHGDNVAGYSRAWSLGSTMNNLEANIPVFGECMWVDGWPKHTDAPGPANVVWGPDPMSILPSSQQSNMMRFCLARHGKAANMAFLDAHVETVELDRLWGLQWAPSYTPSSPPSPVPNK